MKFPGFTAIPSTAILLILSGMILTSCVHESLVPQEPPTPGGEEPCDPNVIYFQNDILPILISNCAKIGCHNAETAEEGIVLDSYNHVMNSDVIERRDPNDSELYEKITENDSDDVMPPPPNQRLSTEQISKIREWIRQGAENTSCATIACETENVTYSLSIKPLVANTCVGCHSGSSPSGNLNFTTHAGLQIPALDGRLFGAISHATGFTAMPLGGNKLAQCQIDMIKIWIDAGAPNN